MAEPVPAAGQPPLKTVGFVVHGGRQEACRSAAAAARCFLDAGVGVVGSREDGWSAPRVELRSPERLVEGLDLIVVFGGDGTFLRAAYLGRDHGVPLVGVNLGRLGFLADLEEDELETVVPRLAAGRFEIEARMTLAVDVLDGVGEVVGHSWALNEASVERTLPQRLVVIEVTVGDSALARVPADAMIVATPTGSTAYAFSAGGPILSPMVDAILLVPVAPHSLFNRTIIVDPEESLSVRPVEAGQRCVVSLDGRESIAVPERGSVRLARGEEPVRMARLDPFDFYERVRRKFHLS